MEPTNNKKEIVQCPYCNSTNVKFIKQKENQEPYDDDLGVGTMHETRDYYTCKDCACEFYTYKLVTTCSGIEIEEDGADEFEINIKLPYTAEALGYSSDSDVAQYINFNEDDYYAEDEDKYIIPKELQWIKDIYIEDCPSIAADKRYLKAKYPKVEISVLENVGRYRSTINVCVETTSIPQLRSLIEAGEDSDNTLEHLLYYYLYDYRDRLADVKDVDHVYSRQPSVSFL